MQVRCLCAFCTSAMCTHTLMGVTCADELVGLGELGELGAGSDTYACTYKSQHAS